MTIITPVVSREFLSEANTAPAVDCYNYTPADDVSELPGGPCRGIYVGSTGNITIITPNGNTVLFQNVPAGSILPVQAAVICADGTTVTAGSIVALY